MKHNCYACGRKTFLLVISLRCLALPAWSATDTLTLKKCAELALRHHPAMLGTEGARDIGEAGYRSSRSGLLPQVSALGTVAEDYLSGSAKQSWGAGVNATQLLFDFGKTNRKRVAAGRLRDAAATDAGGVAQDVVLDAQLAYLDLYRARAVSTAADDALGQAEAHKQLAEDFLTAGRAVRYDVLKAGVDATNARIAALQAESGVRLGRMRLEDALGVRLADSVVLADSVTAGGGDVPDFAAVLDGALKNRPEVVSARLRTEAARASAQAAERSRLPLLTGSAGYQWRRAAWDADWNDGWNAGLAISLPLFTGGTLWAASLQAGGQVKIAEAAEREAENAVALEVERQLQALRESSERVELSSGLREQAELALVAARERYQGGGGSQLELADAELAATRARITRVSALGDRVAAGLRLQRAMGTLVAP